MTNALVWLSQAMQSPSSGSVYGFAFLLATAVRIAIILLIAGVLAFTMRRASAAMRHLVWTLALAATLALPVLTVTVPAWKVPVLPVASAGGQDRQEMMAQGSSPVLPQQHAEPAHASEQSPPLSVQQNDAGTWFVWMLLLWAAGLLLLAGRAAVGELRARRFSRGSERLDPSQMKAVLERISRGFRKSQTVEFRSSDEIAVPFTRGIFHPTIFLPADACHWPREQMEFVIAHEMAHVKRFDCLTQIVAQAACALFWFHPLVWFAVFEMRKDRERACDDVVLSLGHDAAEYAETLLRLTRGLRRILPLLPASVSMAQSSQLEIRMKALLNPRLSHKPLVASRVLFLSVLALAPLFPAATIQATVKDSLPKGMSAKVWKILSKVGSTYTSLKSYDFRGTDEMTIATHGSTYRLKSGVELFSAGTPQSVGARYSGGGPIQRIAGNGPVRPGLTVPFPYWIYYDFGKLPDSAQSARLLGEGSVKANGKSAQCYIIQLHWRPKSGQPEITKGNEETIWVDKSSGLVLRADFNIVTEAGPRTVVMSVHGKKVRRTFDANEGSANAIQRWSTTFTAYDLNGPTPTWLHSMKERSQNQARDLSARMTGRMAPEFMLEELGGKSVSLSGLRGRIVLLNFWDTWCAPCKREESVLKELGKEWGPGSLAILRITDQSPGEVRQFQQRTGESFPTLVNGEGVYNEYQATDAPTIVVINRAGKIAAYHVGFLSKSYLEAKLKAEGI